MRVLVATLMAPVLLLTGLASEPAAAQPSLNPLENSRPLRPGQPRWLEDYRFLDDPAKHRDAFDSLRYQRLGDDAWLQLGGELRYRADAVERPLFGLTPVRDDAYLQQRAQLHADLHLFDDRLRAFVQLENTRSWGKDLQGPRDESRNDIHQAFLENTTQLGATHLNLRLGRQEMAYGTHALVTYAETPNIRQSFDGLRATLSSPDGRRLDAFALRPVRYDGDNFDDGSDNNVRFYGLYGALPLARAIGIDLYAMGIERKERALLGTRGAEDRYTLGTRIHGNRGGFDWSWDLMQQFGDFAGQDIRAWSVWGEGGYTLANPWKVRLGMRLDASSGDSDPDDGKAGTFDPLFPRTGQYGEAGLINPANLILFGPVVGFSPRSDLRIEPGVFRLWRQSDEDAVYLPGMQAVPGSAGADGRALGTSYRLNARWTPTANLTFDLDYQYYDAGKVIRELGGESTNFVALRSSLRF